MSQLSPARRSRRGATQRRRVVESDEDESPEVSQVDHYNLDSKSTANAIDAGRVDTKVVDFHAQPTSATMADHHQTSPSEDIDTSQTSTPLPTPQIKLKNPSQNSRRSVRASRISAVHISTDAQATLSTTESSATLEPQLEHTTPLKDITEETVNKPATVQVLEKFDPTPTNESNGATLPTAQEPADPITQSLAGATISKVEESGKDSRIVITYLVLTNFKSYAGTQTVGPFHTSFSSVVGPNGSGKSNVIDSLLFVFGFRASKMRQGKISALIHNSSNFPDLDYCEVEVHFQEVRDLPGGLHEVIPDSALIISRRAFKNNSSKYYINGRESNFTTVTNLLRDRGVDLDHKRFLILQGEVESIAQMKPKAGTEHDDGLLEYLEDIIGTSKYKTPIEEAAAETETLNEACLERNGRVQHVEKEKKSLEVKKDAALTFIRDENELSLKQSALYQIYVGECEDNIMVTKESVDQTKTQLETEVQNHKGSEEIIKNLQKQYKAEMKQFERLEKETQATVQELAKLDKDAVKYEEKRKHLNNKNKKSEKSIATSKAAVAECSSNAQNFEADLKRNKAEIEEIEKRLQSETEELDKIRESLSNKTQGLSDQIATKQKSIEPWLEKINERQSEIAVAQSELNMLKEKTNANAQDLTAIEDRLAHLDTEKQAKTAQLKDVESQKLDLEAESQRQRKKIDSTVKEEPEIRSKLSSARQSSDEAKASLSKSQTQGNVLTGLMRLKESGRIDGFHGRLGNLATIDQKYDVAISTACPALDNLVVDSVEVGQQCIEYLRKNNLGRANFILLNRLNHKDLSEVETPEDVPRLFDLVKSSHDKFRPAFFSVLQNTLVANDLDQANRIAYGPKRWRVVTLDGQLIDKSGTMSGGGTRVAKGSMSSKVVAFASKDQIAKLEKDQNLLEKEFQDLQQEKRDAEAAFREAQDALPGLETAIQRYLLEIESIEKNIADAQKRRGELSVSQEPSKAEEIRSGELSSKILGLENEVEDLRQHTSGIQDEINVLQEKIMEVGGVKLRGQKAKVDGLREQISTLTDAISSAEVSQAKNVKQKAKQEKSLVESEAELENLNAELKSLEEEAHSQSNDVAKSRREAEEAQEALEARKDEMQVMKNELDEKSAELNDSRAQEIEIRNKLEESQKTLSENQKRLAYWQDKLAKLTLHNLSDLGEELETHTFCTYTRDELSDLDKDVLKGEIAILEEKTQNVNVDLDVLAEYRRRVEEHTSRSNDLAEAITSRDAAKKRCEDLRRLRLEGFMEGFSAISLRLKEMYQMITMGGNAELELVDSLDPFSEGILFSVMPPKKSWKNISNLSGGEKTLSSLALVFALHHYKPTPLYVMDEIDAALDFRNVSIVAGYIKERTKNAQFIVISLRNNMFELASRLIGIYKYENMTKSVTIENKDYIARQ